MFLISFSFVGLGWGLGNRTIEGRWIAYMHTYIHTYIHTYRLTNRALASVVYRSDLETTYRSMHNFADELSNRQRSHYGGGGGPVKVNRRMSRKGPLQDKHGDAGPESMLMMIEDQADAEAPGHPDGADAAVDADLLGRDENDEVQPPATQEELFQDILRKHLPRHASQLPSAPRR